MKILRQCMVGFALLMLTTGFATASVATGVIKWISLDFGSGNGNVVFIKMQVTPTGKPACATNPNADYSFDGSTSAGKNFYAFLLASYISQREVKIGGYDSCIVNASEDIRWVAAP